MAHESNAQSSHEEYYEIWYGGTDFRHVRRNTLEDAKQEADELAAINQSNIRILKINHSKELVDYEPTPSEPVSDTPQLQRLTPLDGG